MCAHKEIRIFICVCVWCVCMFSVRKMPYIKIWQYYGYDYKISQKYIFLRQYAMNLFILFVNALLPIVAENYCATRTIPDKGANLPLSHHKEVHGCCPLRQEVLLPKVLQIFQEENLSTSHANSPGTLGPEIRKVSHLEH